MTETAYPYSPNEFGFDLDPLFNNVERLPSLFYGESGMPLYAYRLGGEFSIKSLLTRPGYFLTVWTLTTMTDNDFLLFDLRTRDLFHESGSRHPDLFAGAFMRKSIEFFEKWNTISGILSQWVPGSVNRSEYEKNRNNGMGLIESARQTWTGRIVSEYDFLPRMNESIWQSNISDVVSVLFSKDLGDSMEDFIREVKESNP